MGTGTLCREAVHKGPVTVCVSVDLLSRMDKATTHG